MILAIQVLLTLSVALGVIMALAEIEAPNPTGLPDGAKALSALLGAGMVTVVWILPFVGVIVFLSLSILRKSAAIIDAA